MIALLLEAVKEVPGRWKVSLGDQVLLDNARDPEHEAARVLQALGFEGPFCTTDRVGRVRMRYPSIAKAAKLTTRERDDGKDVPRAVKWKPFPGDKIGRGVPR